MPLDIQIRGGTIIDGTGCPGYRGNLDVEGDKITAIGGRDMPAALVIDASGCVVCPGFIDVHTHADLYAGVPAAMESFLWQGVTTCIVGNCGFSAFPALGDPGREYLKYAAGVMGRGSCGSADFLSYKKSAQNGVMTVNVASHVGHGMLRSAVMGCCDRPPTGNELENQCAMLERLLLQGAAGLSLGLIYSPGSRAGRDELLALAKTAASCGKPVAVHLRDEGGGLASSIDEMLSISRESGVHMHFSHHKVMGRKWSGASKMSLSMIEQAAAEGLDVSLDAYPYDAACSTAMALLPPWVMSQGTTAAMEILSAPDSEPRIARDLERGVPGWENLVSSCGWDRLEIASVASGNRAMVGKSILQLGQLWGIPPLSALIRLLIAENGAVSVIIRGMDAEDVDRIISFPQTLIGSDGLFSSESAHPRRFGSFARFIGYYSQERGILSLESAISRITAKAALTFSIPGRGLLSPGSYADVAVFCPGQFRDAACYASPELPAVGMRHVLINGAPALLDGTPTAQGSGKIISV